MGIHSCIQPPSGHSGTVARQVRPSRKRSAFTLVEVVVSLMVLGLSVGGILAVYVQCAVRSDWSAQALSAQMMALSGMEQCRAAKYDPRGSPATDELVNTNFPSRVDVLDVGGSSSILAYGTNTTTISTVSTNSLVKLVRVDCVWSFPSRGLFTNSVVTYRAPNQ
jgi:Tfp pilus assembly protein PilV